MDPMFVVDRMNMDLRITGAGVAFPLETVHGQCQQLLFLGAAEIGVFGRLQLLHKGAFRVFAE